MIKLLFTISLFLINWSLQAQDVNPKETVFTVVEERAMCYGCEDLDTKTKRQDCTKKMIYDYVIKNIDSDVAKKSGIKGRYRVVISISLDREGNVSNLKTDSENKRFSKKVKKAFRKFPQMIPYMSRNRPTATVLQVPITFIGL